MSGKQFEVYHLRVAGFLVAKVELRNHQQNICGKP